MADASKQPSSDDGLAALQARIQSFIRSPEDRATIAAFIASTSVPGDGDAVVASITPPLVTSESTSEREAAPRNAPPAFTPAAQITSTLPTAHASPQLPETSAKGETGTAGSRDSRSKIYHRLINNFKVPEPDSTHGVSDAGQSRAEGQGQKKRKAGSISETTMAGAQGSTASTEAASVAPVLSPEVPMGDAPSATTPTSDATPDTPKTASSGETKRKKKKKQRNWSA